MWSQDDDDLLQQALAMSMEGGASGSAAVTDSAMAEAGAVDPDLSLGVFSRLIFAASTILAHTVFVAIN